MSAIPAPLVWDFNRQFGSDAAAHVGGTAHFYDETAQSLFINGGLKTRLCTPTAGHRRDATKKGGLSHANNPNSICLEF